METSSVNATSATTVPQHMKLRCTNVPHATRHAGRISSRLVRRARHHRGAAASLHCAASSVSLVSERTAMWSILQSFSTPSRVRGTSTGTVESKKEICARATVSGWAGRARCCRHTHVRGQVGDAGAKNDKDEQGDEVALPQRQPISGQLPHCVRHQLGHTCARRRCVGGRRGGQLGVQGAADAGRGASEAEQRRDGGGGPAART